MDRLLLGMFQRQVSLQCRFVVLASEQLNASLGRRDVEQVFYAIQGMLNAAANVSKALWGGKNAGMAAQRAELRTSLGVTDASAFMTVSMRNNFEHFDERIDKWWRESKRKNALDLFVCPSSAVVGYDSIDRFRWLNQETGVLTFWSEEFNLNDILTEAKRISDLFPEAQGLPPWVKRPKF